MVDQLTRPKDKVEVYYFTEQPYGTVRVYASLGMPVKHHLPKRQVRIQSIMHSA